MKIPAGIDILRALSQALQQLTTCVAMVSKFGPAQNNQKSICIMDRRFAHASESKAT